MTPHAVELAPDAPEDAVGAVVDAFGANALALASVPGVALSRFSIERVGLKPDLTASFTRRRR